MKPLGLSCSTFKLHVSGNVSCEWKFVEECLEIVFDELIPKMMKSLPAVLFCDTASISL